MASQGDQPPRGDAGIDITTLLLSAIASAAAAYITSQLWGPGTLFSAAMAPVIVALVKEGLRKPTEKVATVATVSRWSRTSASDPGLVAEPDERPSLDVHRDPDAPHVVLPPVVPAATITPVRVVLDARPAPALAAGGHHRPARLRRGRGRFTVPELIAGQSLGGSDKTTIFGGRHRHAKTTESTTSTSTTKTKTSTTETTPPAKTTETVTRTETVTTPAPATTTPTTPAPSTTAPAPSTAAPASP